MQYKKFFKKYGGFIVIGLILITAFKLFDQISVLGQMGAKIITILKPFIFAAIIAYLLYPATHRMENLFAKSQSKFISDNHRILGVVVTFLVFLCLIGVIVVFLYPILKANITEFSEKLPLYDQQLIELSKNLSHRYDIPDLYSMFSERIMSSLKEFFNHETLDGFAIITHGMNFVNGIFSAFMTIVVVPYLLYERRSLLIIFDSLLLLKFREKEVISIHEYFNKIHQIFSHFIFGKAIDSLIIGSLAYLVFYLMDIKYNIVLALIIGVTNMIPYFGPFIGGVPVTIMAALTTGLVPGAWTGFTVLCLQQFDGLLLGPYILGETVGISPFWIVFAITFFGGIMGFAGMLIGVPLIATIRMVYHDVMAYLQVRKKGTIEFIE